MCSIGHVSSMGRGNELSRAASSAKKDQEVLKKRKGRPDTETSSDSDEERAAEAASRRSRDKECKSILSEVEPDSKRVDHMIADAEAKNQAKMAKNPKRKSLRSDAQGRDGVAVSRQTHCLGRCVVER